MEASMAEKAKGQIGSWFAMVGSKSLPCIHCHWLTNLDYHDPFHRHLNGANDKKIQELVNAIKKDKLVVLTNDAVHQDAGGNVTGFTRKDYVAVYRVDRVTYEPESGLRFKLVERLAELA
jgi:hypothetical protein